MCYPDTADAGVTHGIMVFKEAVFGSRRNEWLGLVRPELEERLDPGPRRMAIPRQFHSARVMSIDRAGARELECDGLVTSTPLTALGISVSDCVPIFAWDVEKRVIGLAHCGWRGLAAGIVEELLRVLRFEGSDPADLSILIGAAIGPCCYRVGDDLLDRFTDKEVRTFSTDRAAGVFFDLKAVAASRLLEGGVGRERISIDKTCTSCKKYLLSSYRADGSDCGRMLAYLMLTG